MIPVTMGDLLLVLSAGTAVGLVLGLVLALPLYHVRVIRRPSTT